jgi:sterol desaturase/sphingolipid hydroxylase (fatty acid hydroxylase superfamily)
MLLGLVAIGVIGAVPVRWLERRRPLRRVDWRRSLPNDLIALGHGALCSAATIYLLAALAGRCRETEITAAILAWPAPWRILLVVLANDLVYYWYHRGLHALCWRAHRWHHSAADLYWLSGNRGSTPDVVAQVVPIALAMALFLEPGEVWVVGLIGLAGGFMQHSNVAFRCRPVELILVTPRVHGLHHAVDPRVRGRNFGSLFTVWDRLFGTYADPDAFRDADVTTGLDPREARSTVRMMLGI